MATILKKNLLNDSTIQVLKKFRIFADLSSADIRKILEMDPLSRGRNTFQSHIAKLCRFRAQEILIREGEFDCWSFWVVTGCYQVIKQDRVVAEFSRPGEVFGEMSVLEGIPRTATVKAKTQGICLCLDMSVIESVDDSRIKAVIRKGFSRVIRKRLDRNPGPQILGQAALEEKYAGLFAHDQD